MEFNQPAVIMKYQWAICLSLVIMAYSCSALNILGIVLIPAQSHYFVGSAVMKGLAQAGHKVTFLSPLPPKAAVENLEEIEITGVFDVLGKDMNFFDMANQNPISEMTNLYNVGIMVTNHTLNDKNVQKVMNSGRQFDVVIVELFVSEALIGLGRHFNAPVVAFSTFGASIWTTNLIGNPSPLSFVPHPFLSFTHNMDFFQRVGNTLMTTFETTFMEWSYYPRQEELYKKFFPNTNRSFKDMLKNDVSLVLVNTHFTLGFPRPFLPNMIEVGGMHINRKTAVLPADLQTLLDGAKNGVIYFSMGSNLKSAQMPVEKRNGIISAFRKRKELILWKWEDENLPGKPENVIIRKWFPQDAVLAHPKVKVFITHGGLLSTSESIYYGKPVIGIPVFGDQTLNMKRAVNAGYGVHIDYQNLTESSISWALDTVLSSKDYAKNIKFASERYRDQQNTPLEKAVYWVEYVARHKGAPHLQSHGKQLDFIQYHNLDVFAFLAAIPLLTLILLVHVCTKCFGRKSQGSPKPSKKAKRN